MSERERARKLVKEAREAVAWLADGCQEDPGRPYEAVISALDALEAALDREERLLDQVDDAYRSLEAGRKFEAKECLRSIASAALSSPAEPNATTEEER